ncbi:MAG: hypothetical protein MUF50_02630 [Planctomycetes bacterium]|jgi:dihydroorotase|nr:hypothetical protein [Planctomycetota bacterium]
MKEKNEIRKYEQIIGYDAHVHLREEDMTKLVIGDTLHQFGGCLAMTNLKDPADNPKKLAEYWRFIFPLISRDRKFQLAMPLMLTKNVTAETISQSSPYTKIVKWIPGTTSTNSEMGLSFSDLEKDFSILEAIQKEKMFFSGHFEKAFTDKGALIPLKYQEEEALFLVEKIRKNFPDLIIVFEHISSKAGAKFFLANLEKMACTITLHHLILNDSYLYKKYSEKINPFFYCKPCLKSEDDRRTILELAFSGLENVFFGSDSAPHPLFKKEADPPAAGLFSAPILMAALIELFERHGKLPLLENFTAINARKFYNLEIPEEKITFLKSNWTIPETISNGNISVPVLLGGTELKWKQKFK